MNRWLFFTWLYPPAPGGVEEIVRATARGFADRCREVLVVTSATPDVGAGDRVEDGVRVIRLAGLHPRDTAPVPEEELGAVVEAFAPDAIHAHLLTYPWMPDRSAAVARALRRSPAPLLDQAHGGDPSQDREACVRLMGLVDAVVCDSAYIRGELEALAALASTLIVTWSSATGSHGATSGGQNPAFPLKSSHVSRGKV